MDLLERIKDLDLQLFHLLNGKWSNEWLDAIVPWLRYQQTWYPLYLFLLVFVLYNFGKQSWWWIAGFIITVGVSDSFSSRIVKSIFQRLRPCTDPNVFPTIHLRVPHCAGGFSFVSTHASNHFAMAMFLFITLRPIVGPKMGFIFLWSTAVAYAQVYVGVHYPFDVLGGAILGTLIGWISGSIINKRFPLTA